MTKPVARRDARRLTWDKWVHNDWITDQNLQSCSHAAKGIWMDMLAFAAGSEERGFVFLHGKPATDTQIAKMLKGDPRTNAKLIAELETAKVFSRDSRGAIFSRRMCRDTEALQASRMFGVQGGNPQLRKDKGLAENRVNPPLNLESESDSESKRIPAESLSARVEDRPGWQVGEAANGTVPTLDNVIPLRRDQPIRPPAPVPPAPQPSAADPDPPDWREDPLEGTPPVRDAFPPDRGEAAGQGEEAAVAVQDDGKAAQAARLAAENAAVQLWNRMCGVNGYCSAAKLPLAPDRRTRLRTQLRLIGGLDAFEEAVRRAGASALWQGQVAGTWRPGFDDILKPKLLRGLLEGKYDGGPGGAQARSQTPGKYDHLFRDDAGMFPGETDSGFDGTTIDGVAL